MQDLLPTKHKSLTVFLLGMPNQIHFHGTTLVTFSFILFINELFLFGISKGLYFPRFLDCLRICMYNMRILFPKQIGNFYVDQLGLS